MRATRSEIPIRLEAGDAAVRSVEWGDMSLAVISVPAGTDFGPLLVGLPNDLCPGPHWGYVIKGRLRMQYTDGEEVINAGDFYYMPPGHTGVAEEDTEFLEVVPQQEHHSFLNAARANVAAMA